NEHSSFPFTIRRVVHMQFTKILVSTLTWLCIISITLLTAIVLLQVVSRVSNIFVPGTEELARLLIVWLTFLGSSLAIYEKMHLAVNYFVRKAGEDKRKYVHLSVNILLALFYTVLTVYGSNWRLIPCHHRHRHCSCRWVFSISRCLSADCSRFISS